MKGDFLSYRVAVGRSVLGLVIQTSMAVVLLIYSMLASDYAAFTAFLFAILGLPVWVALAIVYDQHRRERIETMEAETLSASAGSMGGSTSVFDAESAAFRVARSRLAGMYKYFLPIVSVVVGLLLIGVGLWRFDMARALISPDVFQSSRIIGWAVAVGLFVAVTGFIFARFISGMAKQPVWSNLRAGAAVAVGTALMGLAIAVGAVIDYAGPDVVSRYITIVFPAVMIFVGAEIFLNLILDLYRPRKAGEVPRPAFDSRVLGFAAAPDRIADSVSSAINYQLGFDVSSSWFYQLLSRSLGVLVLLGLAVLWGLSALAVVEPHERGIVVRFGQFVRTLDPGLHVKLPWPIDRVEIPPFTAKNERGRVEIAGYTATGVRTVELGTPEPATDTKIILWTNEHAREELYQLVQPSAEDSGRSAGDPAPEQPFGSSGAATQSAISKGKDLALVSVEIPLQYSIKDVEQFDRFAPIDERDNLIKAIAQREVMQYFSAVNADQVLGGDRAKLTTDLTERVSAAFERAQAGIQVLFVGVTGVHPPTSSAANYEKVVQAEQKRQSNIEASRADAIDELTKVVGSVELANKIVAELEALEPLREAARRAPGAVGEGAVKDQEFKVQKLLEQAGGSAAQAVAEARADRWTRHMGERGRSSRYQGQIASYKAAPELYKASIYFDAMKIAVRDSRLFLTDDRVPDLRVNFDLKNVDNAANVFDPNRKNQE